ncbi:8-amino-7-oxononanoate synthase [Serratia rubidaea]|uniref:8-amino-7-oxononanoate synthase n=1 Tax=Serratia rubidaea TaxID=61652 RepID=A0A4V6YXR8_SERRU|nr:8-amino-7-oxononanoate synthase [Serratia rubidaea]
MPPAQACALQAALRCVQQGDALRSRLQQHIARFRRGVAGLPLTLSASQTAIQPLLVGTTSGRWIWRSGCASRACGSAPFVRRRCRRAGRGCVLR